MSIAVVAGAIVACGAIFIFFDHRSKLVRKKIVESLPSDSSYFVPQRDVDIYLVDENGTTTYDVLKAGTECPKLMTGQLKLLLKSGATPIINVDKDLKFSGNLLGLCSGMSPLIIDKHDKFKNARHANWQNLIDKVVKMNYNEICAFVEEVEARDNQDLEDSREDTGEFSSEEATNKIVEEKSKMDLLPIAPIQQRERMSVMKSSSSDTDDEQRKDRMRKSDD
jgi:hypothetical protein